MQLIFQETEKLLPSIVGKDITLRVSISAEELLINGDATQIEQILLNLASNARDAMPLGGALSVQAKSVFIPEDRSGFPPTLQTGRYVLITVTDTGTGIDESLIPKIFEPFFTTKDSGKGTGLGLSIVYSIVRQHKGFIDVQSAKGQGTTFNIYLPEIDRGNA